MTSGLPSRARGFTLIEVVVAFVMLTLVMVTGFEIFTAGLKRAGDLEDYSRALLLAQSKLAAAGVEQPFQEGQLQGDSDDRRYHWSTTIVPSTEGGSEPGKPPNSPYMLFRVDVKVDWQGGDGRAHTMSLATMGLGQK